MSYRQLTLDERYQISAMRTQGMRPAEIARALGRHRSTICRELKRNARHCAFESGTSVGYHAQYAQQCAARRRVECGIAARKIQGDLQVIVEAKLRQGWSPEQISGRLVHERKVTVGTETIYQHVLRDAHEKRGVLRYCLRRGGYNQGRFRRSKQAARTRQQKLSISDRPPAANERRELGHWERDCLLGSASSDTVLLTLVDRKSRYTRIQRLEKHDAEHAAQATIDALAPLGLVRSITNDNGQEFQQHIELTEKLATRIYYCDPSSPWQRGSIENINGLLRQFVPKGQDLDAMPAWAPAVLEQTLNHRPRKVLGFRTPHEVLFRTRMPLMSPLVRFGLEFSSCG